MIIREIQTGEENRWDEYVRSCQVSTPQHLFAWKKVMEEVFKSKTHYFLAEENGTIAGVLPLIHINSLLAGHYITSLPGGLCADSDLVASHLFNHAREFVIAHKAKYLILRDGHRQWNLPGVVTDDQHETFLIEISPDLDQLKHAMKQKTRQLVNKASHDSLTAVIGLGNLEKYYPIYASAMQELGTPTLGLDFFKSTAAHLPHAIDLVTLYYGDKIAGGGFVAPFKQTVYCLWSGLLHEYYDRHTAYLLSWEAMMYAHGRGYQWVDLGRCRKNSGGHDFKKRFGGQVQPLYQQIYLNGIDHAPKVGAARAADLKYRYFIKIWRMLPPPITEALGPTLRKQMPFG